MCILLVYKYTVSILTVYLFVNKGGVVYLKELTRREREHLERENTILSKAEELFTNFGVENVSMDDLAREAEYTKRTLYRYFTCKEDLLFAVTLRGYERLFETINVQIELNKTGYEKIRLAYYAFYDFYKKYPQILLLINRLGTLKANTSIEMPYRKKYLEFDRQLFDKLLQLFEEGQSDHSIRTDVEISKLTYSSIFTITGFFQLLSASGGTYTKHFQLDLDDFVHFTIDMQLDALHNR